MRNNKTFAMSYYNTYYFTNIIENILSDGFEYIRKLHEFFEGYMLLSEKFERYSVLHQFIAFTVGEVFYESIEEDIKSLETVTLDALKRKKFWINQALKHHEIKHIPFKIWVNDYQHSKELPEDLFYLYINDYLQMEKEQLINKLSNEIFYLMFMNRGLLLKLNYFISMYISESDMDDIHNEYRNLLSRSGVLKRISMPEWVKNAVFFRDRGRCVFCFADLTNLVSRLSEKNFDHMVPLSQGGINDISNIQLTCRSCNNKKLDKDITTSNIYELWY
ncbi:HNH endonuclease [Paenibacillus chitinolyticus]|uniref:HNH endonuclease n=1 Tax=Paenibacillus chitinolyticus TaxID=79263 RepID=UPI003556387D